MALHPDPSRLTVNTLTIDKSEIFASRETLVLAVSRQMQGDATTVLTASSGNRGPARPDPELKCQLAGWLTVLSVEHTSGT